MFNKMLLASAAVIVTVAGAQAADLPSKKAAPVNYVKICDTYGAGYFFIPGSETCLKIGGRVRYDLMYTGTGDYFGADGKRDVSVQDTYGMHARGRITLDARTASDYGTVRTYLGLQTSYNTGLMSGVQSPYGDSSAADYISKKTTLPSLEMAYIQFAGFTAGKMPEIASSDWFGNMYNAQRSPSFSTGVFGIAYTAILGGGFSATIGIEDNDGFDGNNVAAFSKVSSSSTVTTVAYSSGTTCPAGSFDLAIAGGTPVVGAECGVVGTTSALVGGLKAPYQTPYDALPLIAGKLVWDQSWGQMQVSGGVAQNRSVLVSNSAGAAPSSATAATYNITRTGYAIGGQLTLNADMIAKGDKFYLLGGYSNGLNKLGYKTAHKDSGESRNIDGIGQSFTNFTCNSTGTICDNTKSTWGTIAFLHYWTPSIRQNVLAGMAWVDPGAYARSQTAATQKTTYTQLGTNLIWSPAKGLDIGVEATYNRASVGNDVLTNALIAKAGGCKVSGAVAAGCSANGDAFSYRLRVQRDF